MNAPVPVQELRAARGRLRKWLVWRAHLAPADVHYPEWPEDVDRDGGPRPVRTHLAVDFGTSAIAAALVQGSHTEPLVLSAADTPRLRDSQFGRRWRLASASLEENYRLQTVLDEGDTGDRWDYFPCLKRRLELLARMSAQGWEEEAVLDVAAVSAQALRAARDAQGLRLSERLGENFEIYMAVPNNFPPRAVEVLARGVYFGAAAATGFAPASQVTTVLEAEAVAYDEFGRQQVIDAPPLKGSALILDAGAGTTDATIVRIEGAGLQVVAHAGLPVGGIDLDALIAELRGTVPNEHKRAKMERLRVVRIFKERFWSVGAGGAAPEASGHAALAQELIQRRGYPESTKNGATLEEALEAGYKRYLGLAVHGILGNLPDEALADVTRVVVSGRASLLTGFVEEVGEALRGRVREGATIDHPTPRGESQVDARKLAVVRGVATFAAGNFVRYRRPLRAGAEVYVQRVWPWEEDTLLMEPGHPLVEGWGVAAFHNPGDNQARSEQRRTIHRRTLRRRVLQSLVSEGFFREADVDGLLAWSSMPILRFDTPPPYTSRVAFNFFLQTAVGEVNGEPFAMQSLAPDPNAPGAGLHPVHRLPEDWFERWFLGRSR